MKNFEINSYVAGTSALKIEREAKRASRTANIISLPQSAFAAEENSDAYEEISYHRFVQEEVSEILRPSIKNGLAQEPSLKDFPFASFGITSALVGIAFILVGLL